MGKRRVLAVKFSGSHIPKGFRSTDRVVHVSCLKCHDFIVFSYLDFTAWELYQFHDCSVWDFMLGVVLVSKSRVSLVSVK